MLGGEAKGGCGVEVVSRIACCEAHGKSLAGTSEAMTALAASEFITYCGEEATNRVTAVVRLMGSVAWGRRPYARAPNAFMRKAFGAK